MPDNREEPAFPFSIINRFHFDESFYGLTKREWFAGMALQGMISDSERNGSFQEFAEGAFQFADAMLATSKEGK